ncbi:unnamed protein product [Vitrella brassicaformis CCMP3155]|uniref:Uncharacterized protein n=1 Tax=Vitrella brassicaformis (strain CCMP3155) TaxID=1169540 RepID=A0A0G4H5L2_VITBC|nr:unnamed protein product [Vitrella brassicaformis CCMP3155]|eukprot:CEM39096.1 unnamed protein product [Vitrella brassicaformis CCMP3155]
MKDLITGAPTSQPEMGSHIFAYFPKYPTHELKKTATLFVFRLAVVHTPVGKDPSGQITLMPIGYIQEVSGQYSHFISSLFSIFPGHLHELVIAPKDTRCSVARPRRHPRSETGKEKVQQRAAVPGEGAAPPVAGGGPQPDIGGTQALAFGMGGQPADLSMDRGRRDRRDRTRCGA